MIPDFTAICVAVFLAALAYDFANTQFLRAAALARPTAAATWSVITYAIGLIGLLGVLRYSTWLVIPEAMGLYVGTWIGVAVRQDLD